MSICNKTGDFSGIRQDSKFETFLQSLQGLQSHSPLQMLDCAGKRRFWIQIRSNVHMFIHLLLLLFCAFLLCILPKRADNRTIKLQQPVLGATKLVSCVDAYNILHTREQMHK